MTTLEEALALLCEPDASPIDYVPLRIVNESEKSIVFMGDYFHSPYSLSATDTASAIAEAETYLVEELGMTKVVDWLETPNTGLRAVWSYFT
jgi:hypothetical protein